MTIMKKTFAVGSSLLVLIGMQLGATYYASSKTFQEFQEIEKMLNDNQVVNSETISYKKGLFKSEAISKVTFKDMPLEKPIEIKHTLYHGPIIIDTKDSSVQFKMALIYSEPEKHSFRNKLFFTAVTSSSYAGALDAKTMGSAFNIQQNNFQVIGAAWSIENTISSDKKRVRGKIQLPQVVFHWQDVHLAVEGIEVLFDEAQSSHGNWLGNTSLRLKKLTENHQGFLADSLKVEVGSVFRDQVIDVSWKFQLEKMMLDNENYGPFQFKLAILNIDPESLKIFTKSNQSVDLEESRRALTGMITKRPKVLIEPSQFILPNGVVHVDAELEVGGPGLSFPIKVEDFEKTIDGNFHLVIPKDLFVEMIAHFLEENVLSDPQVEKLTETQKKELLGQQISLKINKLHQDGILTESTHSYELKISIVNGNWVVDGKEISEPLLASPSADTK